MAILHWKQGLLCDNELSLPKFCPNVHACFFSFFFLRDFPKDHFRENVKRMRQIQRKSKEKETESVKPVKALWKSEKYAEVPSKIKMDLQVNT